MAKPEVSADLLRSEYRDALPESDGGRVDAHPHIGPDCDMKPSGGNDQDKSESAGPTETPDPAAKPGKAAPAGRERQHPSETEQASVAAANPLKTPKGSDRQDREASNPAASAEDQPTEAAAEPAPDPQEPNGTPIDPEPDRSSNRDTGRRDRRRRRPTTLPTPVAWTSLNVRRLLWPSSATRAGARRASRYGLIALTIVMLFTLNEIRIEVSDPDFSPASNWNAFAAIVGAVLAMIVVWIGYFFHSRLAALLSLAGFGGLIVFLYRAGGDKSALTIIIQALLLYMFLHGVQGTIAYHMHGRRKRRKHSHYYYKDD